MVPLSKGQWCGKRFLCTSCSASKILNGLLLLTRVIVADSLPVGMLIACDLQQYIYSIDENMYTDR